MAEKRQKASRKILRPPAERQTEEVPGAAHSAGLDSGLHKEQDGTDSYAFTHWNSCRFIEAVEKTSVAFIPQRLFCKLLALFYSKSAF